MVLGADRRRRHRHLGQHRPLLLRLPDLRHPLLVHLRGLQVPGKPEADPAHHLLPGKSFAAKRTGLG